MIDSELLKVLRCPETRQDLRAAEPALLERLNQQIASGRLQNRAGRIVKEKIDGGLIRADGKFLYPVCQNIPVMLAEEAIAVDPAE